MRHSHDPRDWLPERDALLARLGLEERRSPTEKVLMGLGVFGCGVLLGLGGARLLQNGGHHSSRRDASQRRRSGAAPERSPEP